MITRDEFSQIAKNGVWKQNTSIVQILGLCPLLAVTTNLSINFLRKPRADCRVVARCRLLKLGKTLAVGEVYVYSEGEDEPVAHATGTYAIPKP